MSVLVKLLERLLTPLILIMCIGLVASPVLLMWLMVDIIRQAVPA